MHAIPSRNREPGNVHSTLPFIVPSGDTRGKPDAILPFARIRTAVAVPTPSQGAMTLAEIPRILEPIDEGDADAAEELLPLAVVQACRRANSSGCRNARRR